jgi:hypothetical protein
MLAQVSSYELTEWVAFLQLEHDDHKAEEEKRARKAAIQ